MQVSVLAVFTLKIIGNVLQDPNFFQGGIQVPKLNQ